MNNPGAFTLLASFAFSLATSSCATSPAAVEQKEVSFRVYGDPGKPVANARLTAGGKTIATTNSEGAALVRLSGHEGDAVEIAVVCPGEFQSPAKETKVSLRRLVGEKRIEYAVICLPRTREIVLVINGLKGYRLPIVELGRTIGETDDSGVATLLLHVDRDEQFEVTLDTSAPENSLIRPRNPTATFLTRNEDDVRVFDPQLTLAKVSPTISRRLPPKDEPRLPVRIQ